MTARKYPMSGVWIRVDKKLLITGGAGFIGSNFIRYTIQKYPECKIINLDKLTYAGSLDNLNDVDKNKNYTFVKGDICDFELVSRLMRNVDAVIHFAAETHVDRSIKDASYFIETDVRGTYILLDSARKNDIKRFVHISTDEVYGQIAKGSFKETDALNPRNPYSASKAGADRLAYSFFTTYGLDAVITRSSNNFGPYQHPEKLIPLFVTNIIEGKKVPLYGNGLNVRDWIYVLDNCEAIDFIFHKGRSGEAYNIGGGNEKTNLWLTKFILKELGKDESWISYVEDRLGHDLRYSLDCTKLHNLGWKPRHSFEKSLRETIQWYKNNRVWWRKKKGEMEPK